MTTLTVTKKRAGSSLASFEVLVRKVKETIARGNRRIKTEMVRSAWQVGRYIHIHILHHRGRANYGDDVIVKLSQRIAVSASTLKRSLNVYRELPKIRSALTELDLTHLYSLMSIRDEKLRLEFARRAVEGNWTTRKLDSVIREELRNSETETGTKHRSLVSRSERHVPLLLKPKLGVLYSYRLIEFPPASGRAGKPVQANPGRLKVDLGFRVHHTEFTMRGEIRAGQIVESRKNANGVYSLVSSKREESDLYTYKAWVSRVVDGDTQFVEIDLGFDVAIEQYLRLRGIDCPEISTTEGKKAKAFVEKCLRAYPDINFLYVIQPQVK